MPICTNPSLSFDITQKIYVNAYKNSAFNCDKHSEYNRTAIIYKK